MRPDPARNALALALAVALLGGCASLGALHADHGGGKPSSPVYDRDTQVAVLVADMIQTLQRLSSASPAEQAEIVTTAQQSYERGGGGSAQLRYALVLATPGHPGHDAVRARQLLRELAAQPETLAPVERALSLFELAQLDRELGLLGDNERLQANASHSVDQDRYAATSRRLQAELDENARLRRLLEETQAKLEALANIERNQPDRKSNSEVRKK
ncbi:MAG: hypothetical protein KGL25_05895 [Gammaproteobacteria bacterium]|nr:hypothetical protein [Gammaproteobacteria bacterium]MDE2250921.1 hypothetical protein [Gammaproteobacteria bacterium]